MTYKEYIDNIIKERGQWGIPNNEYFEAHHIVPKCLGGEGDINGSKRYKHLDNIVRLYPHEHFIAHKMLAEENPDNIHLVLAWSMMAYPKGKTNRDFEITPDEYERLRVLQSKVFLEKSPMAGRTPWNKGKTGVYSEETLKRMRKPRPDRQGIKLSEETKNRMSIAQKKRYAERPETFGGRNRGKIAITDGTINKYIDKDYNIPDGFRCGQTHTKYTIADHERYCRLRSEQVSGDKNPMYGKGYKLSGGKNGHATKRYFYGDKVFECRKELVIFLKGIDGSMSVSTVRKFENGSERVGREHPDIFDKLRWEFKDENKVN